MVIKIYLLKHFFKMYYYYYVSISNTEHRYFKFSFVLFRIKIRLKIFKRNINRQHWFTPTEKCWRNKIDKQ